MTGANDTKPIWPDRMPNVNVNAKIIDQPVCKISGSNDIPFGYSMPVGGEIRLFRVGLTYINLKEISQ